MESHSGRGKQRILVVFPDYWAPFCPTLTRLVDLLAKRFEVHVLAFDIGRVDLSVLDPRQYERITVPRWLVRIGILRRGRALRLVRTLLLALRTRQASQGAAHVVAVDADGATACWLAGRRMHYLSLEIDRPSLARWIVPSRACSILIQSQERLEYQFRPASIAHIPVFFIQNAPDADAFRNTPTTSRDLSRPRLVYMGNLIPEHGLFCMLDMLRAWPGASLTLRGSDHGGYLAVIRERYGDLLEGGRLNIHDGYVRDEDIPRFLSGFDIGLCLYEATGQCSLTFNYQSAPAGKMFNYFAAGLPVLASDLIGLRPVSEYSAGIQARSNAVRDLIDAGHRLCANHMHYREGALRAARAFDFKIAAGAFVDFLSSTEKRG